MMPRLSAGPEDAAVLWLAVDISDLEALKDAALGPAPLAWVKRELGISKQRVSDVVKGRESTSCAEPCDGLLTQILAVHAAVEQVGLMIMELHLQHCVLDGVPMERERWNDLRDLLKRWSRLSQG